MNASQTLFEKLSPILGGRIYPLLAPETADTHPPYAVYTLVSSTPDTVLDGITGFDWVRMQVDIYHSDYDELLTTAKDCVLALNTIVPSVYGGTTFLTDQDISQTKPLFRAMIEYEFWQSF